MVLVFNTLFFSFKDNKTALYWAVEKGNATMVRDILQCNPDTETCTKVTIRILIELLFLTSLLFSALM